MFSRREPMSRSVPPNRPFKFLRLVARHFSGIVPEGIQPAPHIVRQCLLTPQHAIPDLDFLENGTLDFWVLQVGINAGPKRNFLLARDKLYRCQFQKCSDCLR